MNRSRIKITAFLAIAMLQPSVVSGEESTNHAAPNALDKKHLSARQITIKRFFRDEVWAKVVEQSCLKCHNPKGEADESELILHDPANFRPGMRAQLLERNLATFEKVSVKRRKGQSVLLLKAIGKLTHEGEQVLKSGSTRYRILEGFVNRVTGKGFDDSTKTDQFTDYDPPSFFDGITMLEPRRLLRRITLSLAARLPTDGEKEKVRKSELKALNSILDEIMTEQAFFDRLAEGFNDILLIRGYDGGGEDALSYEHFKTRLWYQDRDPRKGLNSEKKKDLPWSHPKMVAYTKLIREYRDGMRREPLELITHIVRNHRPFTEIVTADYIMVSPYTSRGYGIYEELKGKFKNPDDPYEFIPTKIKALKSRNGRKTQESATGFYPHAGLLTSFQYLKRFPTSETNRNRLRVRMYFQHFLGTDIMALAPRVADAAAVSAKYNIPTMQAADCMVCHKVIDPIAGLYQDYYVVDGKGVYGPRKEGWYKDMFPPGLEGKGLKPEQRWRSVQLLGEQTAKDPRFAVAMVEHVWYVLSGRKVLLPPQDIEDPMFVSKRRAYRMQRDEIEGIAGRFAKNGFNLKDVFKELIASPFYRADGLAAKTKHPRRRIELNDLGLAHLLSPEQLERKIEAIFGKPWGKLQQQMAILYGGIDSKEITVRIADPSGAMGAIQRIMANDVACKNVAPDFSLPAAKRRLFPHIEFNVLPGTSKKADQQIRRGIVHLHELLLGRFDTIDSAEVHRTFDLFEGIVKEAKARKGIEKTESYFCQTQRDKTPRDPDPDYTIRAWRGVVTYLLRQQEFLYE